METIKTYLDNLFLQLPKTPEVLRAREELLEMMEDKYEELKKQGKAEHEAIGTVIAEFGNLDEILEELHVETVGRERQERGAEHPDYNKRQNDKPDKGQNDEAEHSTDDERRQKYEEQHVRYEGEWSESFENYDDIQKGRVLSFEEVRDFLQFRSLFGLMIGLGVALCILSPVGVILWDDGGIRGVLALVWLFVCVTIAVGLFVYFGIQNGKYEYLSKEIFALDEITEGMLLERYEEKRSAFAVLIVLGVVFCILSVIPVIVFDELGTGLEDTLGPAILLVIVAIGVFFLVYAGITKGSYTVLFQREEYTPGRKRGKKKRKKVYNAVENCYWCCVTGFYFLWSFLRMNWGRSWIVFVIAGLVWAMIESIWNMKDKE